jgi:ADP-ribose pyrophosphatase
MQTWKTHSKRVLCQPNRFLKVELHELELPDGRRIADWPWLITPDYANVLARTRDGRFLCFRQTKYAVAGVSLAPVGGFIEPGEEPLTAAQRELQEETGYGAREWHALGHTVVDANRGAGVAHFFLALPAAHGRSGATGTAALDPRGDRTGARPGRIQSARLGSPRCLGFAIFDEARTPMKQCHRWWNQMRGSGV